MLLVCWDQRDVGPQLARAVGAVVCEEILAICLIEEMVRNHARPGISQTRVTVIIQVIF